jgi:hypothetical protein
MDGTANHHVKQNKPDLERQILHVLSQMQNLDFFFKDIRGDYLGRRRPGGEHNQSTLYVCMYVNVTVKPIILYN